MLASTYAFGSPRYTRQLGERQLGELRIGYRVADLSIEHEESMRGIGRTYLNQAVRASADSKTIDGRVLLRFYNDGEARLVHLANFHDGQPDVRGFRGLGLQLMEVAIGYLKGTERAGPPYLPEELVVKNRILDPRVVRILLRQGFAPTNPVSEQDLFANKDRQLMDAINADIGRHALRLRLRPA